MKKGKYLLLAGMLALALTFGLAGCGEKGGTVTVTNGTDTQAYIAITVGASNSTGSTTSQWVNGGGQLSASIDEDGIYSAAAGSTVGGVQSKTGNLSGGESVNLTWDGYSLK